MKYQKEIKKIVIQKNNLTNWRTELNSEFYRIE